MVTGVVVIVVVSSCTEPLPGGQSAWLWSARSAGNVLSATGCSDWVVACWCPSSCPGVLYVCPHGSCSWGWPCLWSSCNVLWDNGCELPRRCPATKPASVVLQRPKPIIEWSRCGTEQEHLPVVKVAVFWCFQTVSGLPLPDVTGFISSASSSYRKVQCVGWLYWLLLNKLLWCNSNSDSK